MADWWDAHPVAAVSPSSASAPAPAAAAGNWWEAHPQASSIASTAPPSPPEAAPKPETPITADNVVRSTARGVPILGGLADKLNAATYAGLQPIERRALTALGFPADETISNAENFADRYSENLGKEQGKDAGFDESHPAVSTAAKIAGGVASTIPLAATGIGAKVLGLGTKNLPASMAAASAGGAAINAADAATRGEDIGTGAKWGLIGGALAPIAGRVIGGVAAKLFGPGSNVAETSAAGKALLRAAADDGITPENISSKLDALGPQGMIADLGPNLRSQVEALHNVPGANQEIIGTALSKRAGASSDRLNDLLDNTIGPSVDTDELGRRISTFQKAQADPLYDKVRASPVEQTPALQEVLSRPYVGVAYQKGVKMAQLRGTDVAAQPMAALDATKQALDDMVSTAKRSGRNNFAGALMDARDKLVTELDRQVPAYADARDAYAGPAAVKDAIETGSNIFSKNMTPEAVAAEAARMSQSEKIGLLAGARRSLSDKISQTGNGTTATRTLLQSGWNQPKIAAIIGDEQAGNLFSGLDRENTFTQTHNVQRDPRTAARLAASKEFPSEFENPEAPDLDMTMTGIAGAAARKAYSSAAGTVLKARRAADNVAAAKALTATGADRNAFVDAFIRHPMVRAEISARRQAIAHSSAFSALPTAAAGALTPSNPQSP